MKYIERTKYKNGKWGGCKENHVVKWLCFGITQINQHTCNMEWIEEVVDPYGMPRSPSYHSTSSPIPMSNDMAWSSTIPPITSTSTLIERPMTKLETL